MNEKTPHTSNDDDRALELLLAVRGGTATLEELAEFEQLKAEGRGGLARTEQLLQAAREAQIPAPGSAFTDRVMAAAENGAGRPVTAGRSRAGGRFHREVASQRAVRPAVVMARLFAIYLGVAAAILLGRAIEDPRSEPAPRPEVSIPDFEVLPGDLPAIDRGR